ncbi:MAG TPA: hypothetical protein VMV92_07205 [Streptosporangiaceae bacterium]|nr:hypothetical protein [Streptosporangiaceae bacterium]HVB44678.1 hypothetical protein [Streptosporangiaceae bacterium]
MEIVYPPTGIVHITASIPDLIADRMEPGTRIQVACAMQPKAAPHFGTGIVLMSAFALARLFQDAFAAPATVLLDMLDNAPAQRVVINDVEYTLCLSHAWHGGQSAADANTEPVRRLAAWASRQAGIPFRLRRYREIQAQPTFRQGLARILSSPDVFEPLFSPSEHRLRIRPMCPRCGLVDKTARTVQITHDGGAALLFTCGYHGIQAARLDDPAAVIDTNTPIRTVLRSLCFSRDRHQHGIETIVLNGGDWSGAWMQRVYFDGLHQLGCSGSSVPFNIFTPQILDDSGAKLSKTIYLAAGTYADVPPTWTSMQAFEDRFGPAGLTMLWDEVSTWAQSPEKFFRNYSVRYLEHSFGESRERMPTATGSR